MQSFVSDLQPSYIEISIHFLIFFIQKVNSMQSNYKELQDTIKKTKEKEK